MLKALRGVRVGGAWPAVEGKGASDMGWRGALSEVRGKDVRCVWGGHKIYQNQRVSDLA